MNTRTTTWTQVYKARLRVNGNLVAIKVQRPNCESTISLDLYVLRFYAGFLTKALKALNREVDLTSIIDDFGELIYREIDYRAEMVNCQRFAELYANIPDVFVPKVRKGEDTAVDAHAYPTPPRTRANHNPETAAAPLLPHRT